MENNEFVSVCMPIFNGGEYLPVAIESVLAQSYRNFELILVDDSSTDDSRSVLDYYASRDPRVEVFHNEKRLGLVGNWNECIKRSKGRWVKFVFQDDHIAPECVERLVECAISPQHPVKAVFCRRDFFCENEGYATRDEAIRKLFVSYSSRQFMWDQFPGKTVYRSEDILSAIVKWPGRNMFGEPTSFLIEREIFEELGLFDDKFVHICDLEYWLRLGTNYNLGFVNEPLAFFRVHGGSTTAFNRSEKWFQTRYLDRLRMFQSFLNSPHYKNLRDLLTAWPKRYFLEAQIAIFLRRARLEASAFHDDSWYREYHQFEASWGDLARYSRRWLPLIAIPYYLSKLSIILTRHLKTLRSSIGG